MPTAENYEVAVAMADQIRDTLESAFSSSNVDIQVEPTLVVDATPPTVDIFPADIAYGTETRGMGGRGELLFTVRTRVNPNDADANQVLLYELMDDLTGASVVGALLDDTTLGGLAADVHVDESSVTGFLLYGGLVGFQFTAAVIRADS